MSDICVHGMPVFILVYVHTASALRDQDEHLWPEVAISQGDKHCLREPVLLLALQTGRVTSLFPDV